MAFDIWGLFSVLGRFLLCVIFVMAAIGGKILNYQATLGEMDKHHVPYPQILLPGAIAFLLIGSASVIAGFRARVGAALLLTFLVLATYFFHDFWHYAPDSKEFPEQMIQFMKNLSMAGAMLFIIGNGSGRWSLSR